MITVSNYKSAENADGQKFFMLELMGGVETVQSQETGKFYLTARKAWISTTFGEEACKGLVNTKMPGGIEKVEVDPYEYTVEATGETVTLTHSWQYNPNLQTLEEAVFEDVNTLEPVID